MSRLTPLFLVTLAIVSPLAETASAQPPALTIEIESPVGGVEDVHAHMTQLSAAVSDPTILTATLTIHGASYQVPVSGGRIEQTIVVAPGTNRVAISARRGDEVATESVTWFVRGEPTDLLVLATWASRGEIVDLWVREPGGETCKWDHRTTASGGGLLDFSADAIGLGSQAYVASSVGPGTYRIKLHYWGGTAEEDARSSIDLDDMLGELDAADTAIAQSIGVVRVLRQRERDRLARRIDRWALPAAPQTPVHVEAILFPGTRHERRWRFDRVIERVGHLATLGEIEIDEALVRAVRADRESR